MGGSFLMHKLVNEWVGLPVIFLIILVGAVGLSLLFGDAHQLPPPHTALHPLYLVGSVTTWVTRPFVGSFFFYPGGIVGEKMYQWLHVRIGTFGVVLVVVLTAPFDTLYVFRGVNNAVLGLLNAKTGSKWVPTQWTKSTWPR